MAKQIKIGVLGAEGRMGCAVRAQIAAHKHAVLAAALTHKNAPVLGTDAGGVVFTDDIKSALEICDVLVDFSHPRAAIDAALLMYNTPCKILITGTTGYLATEEQALEKAASAITLVKSGNFSIGMCVLEKLVEQAARALPKDWDTSVIDIHHSKKKDAPSGTALMLGRALAHGGRAPAPDNIVSLRHGGVVGEHSVIFASDMETISLKHTALERAVFAKGALVAAFWAVDQDKGLYNMADVLGL